MLVSQITYHGGELFRHVVSKEFGNCADHSTWMINPASQEGVIPCLGWGMKLQINALPFQPLQIFLHIFSMSY